MTLLKFADNELKADPKIDFLLYEKKQHDSMSLCKTGIDVYYDTKKNSFKERPNTCKSPFCEKCKGEKRRLLQKKYIYYLDKKVYPKTVLRHLIATTRPFPRGDLKRNIDVFLKNIKIFHKRLSDSLGYAFSALCLIEVKYQPDSDTYYIHNHYGVMTFVNQKKMQKIWRSVWDDPKLQVRWPRYGGEAKYTVSKKAFVEYISKRRTEQSLTMPRYDFYRYVKQRQLIKVLGLNKIKLALVKTIREKDLEQKKSRYIYLTTLTVNDDIKLFKTLWIRQFTFLLDEADTRSVQQRCFLATLSTVEEIEQRAVSGDVCPGGVVHVQDTLV